MSTEITEIENEVEIENENNRQNDNDLRNRTKNITLPSPDETDKKSANLEKGKIKSLNVFDLFCKVNTTKLKISGLAFYILWMSYALLGNGYRLLFFEGLLPGLVLLFIGPFIYHYPAKFKKIYYFTSFLLICNQTILLSIAIVSSTMDEKNVIKFYQDIHNILNNWMKTQLDVHISTNTIKNTPADILAFTDIYWNLSLSLNYLYFLCLKTLVMPRYKTWSSGIQKCACVFLIVSSLLVTLTEFNSFVSWISKFNALKSSELTTLNPQNYFIKFGMIVAWLELWMRYILNDNLNSMGHISTNLPETMRSILNDPYNVIESVLLAFACSFHIASANGVILSTYWLILFKRLSTNK